MRPRIAFNHRITIVLRAQKEIAFAGGWFLENVVLSSTRPGGGLP